MPRHVKTILWATLVVAAAALSQVVAYFAGGEPTQPMLWAIAAAFVVVGIATLVYGSKQEDEKDRATVYGVSIVPFGCFVAMAAFAIALLIIANADVASVPPPPKPTF